MIERVIWLVVLIVLGCLTLAAQGQSSSLYVEESAAPAITRSQAHGGRPDRLSPALAAVSFSTVNPPEQRFFATHDLVTIIVRESTEAESESTLDTTKDASFDGGIEAWPGFRGLDDVWDLFVKTDLKANPRLAANFKKQFNGDGEYERTDTFTTRLTARVIDVKPNGTLVLEARKYIKSDKEELDMVLTGTCRAEDVKADNTVLSTQLYDLRLNKDHKGELKNTTKKGILTKIFDVLFAI